MLTLRFAPSLGGFDDRPLADFVRDKEVLAIREHFFTVHDLPHIACLVTYQDGVVASPDAASEPKTTKRRAKRPDPTADLDDAERVLFGTVREWRGLVPFVAGRRHQSPRPRLPPDPVFARGHARATLRT